LVHQGEGERKVSYGIIRMETMVAEEEERGEGDRENE